MHRAESIGREEPEPPEHLLSMLSMPDQYKIAGEHRDGWKCKQTTKQNCKKLSGNRKNGGKSMIKNLCQKKPKVYCENQRRNSIMISRPEQDLSKIQYSDLICYHGSHGWICTFNVLSIFFYVKSITNAQEFEG